jgi:hypothetical protein
MGMVIVAFEKQPISRPARGQSLASATRVSASNAGSTLFRLSIRRRAKRKSRAAFGPNADLIWSPSR